jgi:hypothetical protein
MIASMRMHCLECMYAMQAPIPLTELINNAQIRGTGFIPCLRDALLKAFMDATARVPSFFRHRQPVVTDALPVQASSTRMAIMMVFKVLGGRLLCQLHTRAARHDQVPDAWFHAPGLLRAQFHRGAPPKHVPGRGWAQFAHPILLALALTPGCAYDALDAERGLGCMQKSMP